MARDFCVINTTIWQDADFRALPAPAQHLYLLLWTHPDLSYCGVADYRPGRIAKFSEGLTATVVETLTQCLESRHFLVIDRESEEVMVRSWLHWDGVMKQPRIAVSMTKAYASTASNLIRGVVVHELHKIRDGAPELACWGHEKVRDVMSQPSINPKAEPTPEDPLGDGFTQWFTQGFTHRFTHRFGQHLAQTLPKHLPSVSVPPTTSTSTSTSATKREAPLTRHPQDKRGTRIPDDWHPSQKVIEAMASERPDVDQQVELLKFRDYWAAKTGSGATKLDWDATYRNWIRNSNTSRQQQQKPEEVNELRYWSPPEPPDDFDGDLGEYHREQAALELERRRRT